MKSLMAFSASAALAAAPMIAIPHLALAYTTSWDYDPCKEAQKSATTRGAVTGGVLGAVAGALLGGGRHRVAGAVVGGAVGAVAGSQIARGQVRCLAYPYGYRPHPGCHWVYDHGRGFEICRGRDGYWRPWDRGY